EYESRVFGLDVFRAIAILIVVMGHGGFIIDKVLPGFPYIPMIDGVELFFVLSGFLIGTILLKIYQKNDGINFSE
ncbi:MAG TPA: acyltransferase, partial [Bacteroidia bacterium]|nr:acyltransferase [Bacteroidia bacterium]